VTFVAGFDGVINDVALIAFDAKKPSGSSLTVHIPVRTLFPTLPHLLQGDHVSHAVNTSKSWPGMASGG
jgi:hypothetical protein